MEKGKDIMEPYYARRNGILLLQIVLSIGMLVFYLFSGSSRHLFRGLNASFGEMWGMINLLYITVTVFGYYVLMFPTAYYRDYVLENHYKQDISTAGAWMGRYLRKLIFDLLLLSILFNIIYLFLRVSPKYWWVYVTLCYIVFGAIIEVVLPAVFSRILSDGYAIPDREHAHHILDWARELGLKTRGVQMWGAGEHPSVSPIIMGGIGRSKTILIESTSLEKYSWEELDILIARKIAHVKMNTQWRELLLQTLLLAIGLYVTHLFLSLAVSGSQSFGIEKICDITTVPVLLLSAAFLAVLILPLLNYCSQHLEFRADEYAVRAAKSPTPLICVITKQNEQDMSNPEPAAWVEVFFHRTPSVKRRIMRAEKIGVEL